MGKTILLVEDEAIIAMMERQNLKAEGYEVLHAFSGEVAIETVRSCSGKVDLILMDINLGSGMDGPTTATEILKEYEIPILFLSSHTEKDIVEKTERISSYGYVVKNTGIMVLAASIKMVFKLHEAKLNLQRAYEELSRSEHEIEAAEIENRKINANLSATLEALPDLMFEMDRKGMYLDIWAHDSSLLIPPKDSLVGRTVREVLPLEAAMVIEEAIQECDSAGISQGKQYRLDLHDTRKWFEISMSKKTDSHSGETSFIFIARDITERIQYEEELVLCNKLQQQLVAIAATMPGSVFTLRVDQDDQMVFPYISPGIEAIAGVSGEAIRADASAFWARCCPGDLEHYRSLVAESRRSLSLCHAEISLTHPEKGERWIAIRSMPQRESDGTTVWHGLMFDTTERKRIYADLKQRERELRSLADNLPICVIRFDCQGRIAFVSRSMENYLQLPAGNLIGNCLHELWPDGRFAAIGAAVVDAIAQGIAASIEISETGHDGCAVYCEVGIVPEKDESGITVGAIAFGQDITERKTSHGILRQLNRGFRAVSDCNQSLLHAGDEQSLLDEVCRIVCERAGYCMAWIGYAQPDSGKSMCPMAWAGISDGYGEDMNPGWADTERGRGRAAKAIRRAEAALRGYHSRLCIPLKDGNDAVFGMFCIYASEAGVFTDGEKLLLEELASDVAYGITALRSREAKSHLEKNGVLFEALLDRMHDAVIIINRSGRIDYVNDAYVALLGYGRARLVSMSIADIAPSMQPGIWAEYLDIVARNGGNLIFETENKAVDGKLLPVEFSISLVEYGTDTYNLGIVRNRREA